MPRRSVSTSPPITSGETAGDPKVSKAEQTLLPAVRFTDIKPETLHTLERWLESAVQRIQTVKDRDAEMIRRIREVLAGRNPDPPMRTGVSNVSVPLMMWANAATRTRLSRNFFGHSPPVKIKLQGPQRADRTEEATAAKNLGDFLVSMMLNTRELDARAALDRVDADMVNIGSGTWAVISTPPRYRNIAPVENAGQGSIKNANKVLMPGRVRWVHIPWDDLLYFNGYGADVNRMPFVGYVLRKTWTDLKEWAAQNYYDKDAVEAVQVFYAHGEGQLVGPTRDAYYETATDDDRPAELRPHGVAEIYADYDINGDGFPEAIVIDYHVQARKILRVGWNQFDGMRPIVSAPYDLPPIVSDFRGQGLGEKLDSPQTEASAIHNIGIESGKRGIANILIVREHSGLDEEIGDDEVVIPGEVYITSMLPNESVQSVPLGDPRAAEHAVALEEVNTRYAFRLTGLDEGSLGQVSAGKRVPKGLGLPIMREGRVTLESALISKSNAVQEACYLTLTAWRKNLPAAALNRILGPESAEILQRSVFNVSASDPQVRETFAITIAAKDIASTEEAQKQSLLAMVQFLMGFYERVVQMLQLIAQMPPAAPILLQILEKMGNSVSLILAQSDDVDTPSDVLLDIDDVRKQVNQTLQAAGAPAAQPGGANGEASEEAVEALGANVT